VKPKLTMAVISVVSYTAEIKTATWDNNISYPNAVTFP